MEQEADRAYQSAMKEPLQVGAEDREAMAMEGMRQAQGLSPDRQGRDLGIERGRDLPESGRAPHTLAMQPRPTMRP